VIDDLSTALIAKIINKLHSLDETETNVKQIELSGHIMCEQLNVPRIRGQNSGVLQ